MQKKEFVPEGILKEIFDRMDMEEEAARRILELSAELHLTIKELDSAITIVRKKAYISPVPPSVSSGITDEKNSEAAKNKNRAEPCSAAILRL